MLSFWQSRPGFHAIQLSRNFGKEAALMAGLESSRFEAVVTMDADLQHAPDDTGDVCPVAEGLRSGVCRSPARRDEDLLKRLGTRGFTGS